MTISDSGKISDYDEELMRDICRIRNIKLFNAKKDNNNYKFDFDKIPSGFVEECLILLQLCRWNIAYRKR